MLSAPLVFSKGGDIRQLLHVMLIDSIILLSSLVLQRFRILKTGIRIHDLEAVDKIWRTCCALHNMLLEEDDLAANWVGGDATSWEQHKGDEFFKHDELDAVKFGLHRDYDVTELEGLEEEPGDAYARPAGQEDDEEEEDNIPSVQPVGIKVNDMSLDAFRAKLIEHFTIKFRMKEVYWPSRFGKTSWNPDMGEAAERRT